MNYELRVGFVKGLSLMPPKWQRSYLREVADRGSDGGSQSACAQAARLILLSRATKVCKNALSCENPKEVKLPLQLVLSARRTVGDAGSYNNSQTISKYQINFYRQFNISPLCHSSAFFRTSLFKTAFHKADRYFLLFIHPLPCVFIVLF